MQPTLKLRKETIQEEVNLLALAEGFMESRILFSLEKLGLFRLLGDQAKPLEVLATELEARPDTLARLLNAGVALKILDYSAAQNGHQPTYRIRPHWQPLLVHAESETYLGNWLRFLDYLSAATARLDEAALHGGPLDDLLALKQEGDIREFTLAMHNYAALRGKELVHFLDTSDCRTLLDLGTGPGTYAFHLGMANPSLALYLLDLPDILAVTREVQGRYPLPNDITYLPVDVTREEIPGRYDMILVSNTLHMLGEAESRVLLRRLYKAINPGGSLVVQAQYMQDDRLGKRWPLFLDLIQLCITPHGRNHTVEETRRWMADAGYVDIQSCKMTFYNTNGYLRGYRRSGGA